jgi:hypothetical protein
MTCSGGYALSNSLPVVFCSSYLSVVFFFCPPVKYGDREKNLSGDATCEALKRLAVVTAIGHVSAAAASGEEEGRASTISDGHLPMHLFFF